LFPEKTVRAVACGAWDEPSGAPVVDQLLKWPTVPPKPLRLASQEQCGIFCQWYYVTRPVYTVAKQVRGQLQMLACFSSDTDPVVRTTSELVAIDFRVTAHT